MADDPYLMHYNYVINRSLFGGTISATFLYGITCAQILYYFWHYKDDKQWLKRLVSILWFLDTITACLNTTAFWGYATQQLARNMSWDCTAFITSLSESGDYNCYPLSRQEGMTSSPPDNRMAANNLLSVGFISTAIIVCLVQSYYVNAIWKTSKRTRSRVHLTVFLLFLIMCSYVLGLVNAIWALRYGDTIPAEAYSGAFFFSLQMCSALIADILITTLLWKNLHRGTGEVDSTKSMISKLKGYIVERALLTTVAQGAQLIIYYKPSITWIAVQLIASKLYVNSLLALLNAREYVRSVGELPINLDEIECVSLGSSFTAAGDLTVIPDTSHSRSAASASTSQSCSLVLFPCSESEADSVAVK